METKARQKIIFSVELMPVAGSSDKEIELFERRVARIARSICGDIATLYVPHAIRCVFWHPGRVVSAWNWDKRRRLHDAVIVGTCAGINLPEHLVAGVLLSWQPDDGQPRVLVDVQRLKWKKNEIVTTR